MVFFFQEEDGIRDSSVTGVQTCALPIFRGLTWVADDATETSPEEGALGPGFAYVAARRLLASGKYLWLATDGGLLKIDPGSGRSRRFDLGGGLPSEDLLDLAPAPHGIWLGTARGLAVITGAHHVVRIGG